MLLTIFVRIAHPKSLLHIFVRGRRTATIKADCVCDLRALTRAALLEALSQYPGDKEPKGSTPWGGTNEWQRWADVIFYWPQVMRKCWGRKASSCWIAIFFSKHLAVLPKLCQKKSWQRWNQEKRSLWFSKLSAFSFSGSSSFLELKAENQEQSGHFPRWGISDL